MKTCTTILLCSLTAGLAAQNQLTLPATANPALELPNYSLLPFMAHDARLQMFFDATEVGAATFTATELSFRYDGPIPPVGSPGPFTIADLQIRVGTTTVAVPESRFANNLTTPLTTVFSGPWTYFPDQLASGPQPWGESNDSLHFVFNAPLPITIPTGGWLVVEMAMTDNNFTGYAHTFLDGVTTTGGPIDGQSVNYGAGCAINASAVPATIGITGLRAPGAAHFLTGDHLGANSPVVVMFGLDDTQGAFGPLPYNLPGTNCALLTSVDATSLVLADASGSLIAGQPGAAFAVPNIPVAAGLVVYEQLGALVPGANPFDVVLSDALAVTLGSMAPLGRGTYTVVNDQGANAPIATEVKPFGFAVRIGTL
ncbi:MAG: hypothetical protein H6838_09635 [Planctomycetes bacterium]|nr:hypothetical protein [Planctomycetota bacterium]